MKFVTVATLIAATIGVVAAQPHRHSHQHFHQKKSHVDLVDDLVERETISKIVYVLPDGEHLSKAEALEGLRNGTFILSNGAISKAPAPAPKPAPAPAPKHKSKPAPAPAPKPKKSGAGIKIHTPDVTTDLHNGGGHFHTKAGGEGEDFPDGQIACSDFPSQFGALALPYVGLGGWSGIQSPGSDVGGFGDITTFTSEMCDGSCPEGAFCSYACPPGLEKTQWPATQGATGQSVGGLQCTNGKLHLTNPSQKKLCAKGAPQVQVKVKNSMSQGAAVCRTDYPGTENMVIPVDATPGSINALACPDENYYNWEGKQTSAQYYVNPKGLSVSQACQWGTEGDDFGNFAPLNLGVGYTGGLAWLSIFQNTPTTNSKLNYNVELVGDNLSDTCKYIAASGQYCSGSDYSDCNTSGCTVSFPSGVATFVFTD